MGWAVVVSSWSCLRNSAAPSKSTAIDAMWVGLTTGLAALTKPGKNLCGGGCGGDGLECSAVLISEASSKQAVGDSSRCLQARRPDTSARAHCWLL